MGVRLKVERYAVRETYAIERRDAVGEEHEVVLRRRRLIDETSLRWAPITASQMRARRVLVHALAQCDDHGKNAVQMHES